MALSFIMLPFQVLYLHDEYERCYTHVFPGPGIKVGKILNQFWGFKFNVTHFVSTAEINAVKMSQQSITVGLIK